MGIERKKLVEEKSLGGQQCEARDLLLLHAGEALGGCTKKNVHFGLVRGCVLFRH